MATTTLTLALEGDVPLDRFAKTVKHFCGLVYALTDELDSAAEIEWLVADAIGRTGDVTVVATSSTREAVDSMTSMFLDVGKALAGGQPIPYSDQVRGEARALTSALDANVPSLRFETAMDEVIIPGPNDSTRRSLLVGAHGSVEGRVQPIASHTPYRFVLFHPLRDAAVACYLSEDQYRELHRAWGRRARVEGWVTRDALSGRPLSVRQVKRLTILEEGQLGSHLRARGVSPAAPGDATPEERIRHMRDADG